MILALLLIGAIAPSAPTSNQKPPQLRDVAIDQKLNSKIPEELTFRDESGKPVTFGKLTSERPAILALVYYGCPRLCNMTLSGLVKPLKVLPFTPGKEFDVVAVSFDDRETPTMAAQKKEIYVSQYGRMQSAAGWHFLTGDKQNIERLAKAVGFGFQYDAAQDQFAHASGIMVLTPGGRVSKYLYGIEYSARDLKFALTEAAAKRIGNPVDQLLLYCFHYDPDTGRYSLSILKTVRILALVTFTMLIGFIVFASRRHNRETGR